jgi:hypothetical protein
MNNGLHVTKLTLKEYLNALGNIGLFRVANAIGLPDEVLKTALRGLPIAYSYAQKIAQYLSQEFDRDIQVSDIKDLKTINPGREKRQKTV